jgi:hypothetical protein
LGVVPLTALIAFKPIWVLMRTNIQRLVSVVQNGNLGLNGHVRGKGNLAKGFDEFSREIDGAGDDHGSSGSEG